MAKDPGHEDERRCLGGGAAFLLRQRKRLLGEGQGGGLVAELVLQAADPDQDGRLGHAVLHTTRPA